MDKGVARVERGLGEGWAGVERGLSPGWARVVRGLSTGWSKVERASLDNETLFETYMILKRLAFKCWARVGQGFKRVERGLGKS